MIKRFILELHDQNKAILNNKNICFSQVLKISLDFGVKFMFHNIHKI